MYPVYGSGGEYQPDQICEKEMQHQEIKVELVVVFIRVNGIVEQEGKENYCYPDNGSQRCLTKINKSRSSVNISVISGNIIEKNPSRRNDKQTEEIPCRKFDGDFISEFCRLNNLFPVNKK